MGVGAERVPGQVLERPGAPAATAGRLHGRSAPLELHVAALAQRLRQRLRVRERRLGPGDPRRVRPSRVRAAHLRLARLHLTPGQTTDGGQQDGTAPAGQLVLGMLLRYNSAEQGG